jgi:hypothetical protein
MSQEGFIPSKFESMSTEELNEALKDEELALKVNYELDKIRRKRDEKWIRNLVDFTHTD